ncbi:MAG TPA: hypothetical protein PKZ84_09730 [Anaerolineae bacterium]|nr:hypothetical protein [Anaerolineae bacterium]HQI84932.1 hypothetical protein [Anaerolineae bacterium]
MTVVLTWLGRQALWVGLICLLGTLGYVVTAISTKRRRDIAQFSLEREVYQQRLTRAWLMATLFLLLGGVVLIVRAFVAPLLPAATTPTPTLGVGLFTVTPAPLTATLPSAVINPAAPLTATVPITSVVISAPQATPTAMVTETPTPTPPDVYQPDCPSPEAQLTLPTAGGNLSGEVRVEGTANINAFSYYKFEVQFPGSDTPNFVSQYDAAVINGFLGVWDVSDPSRYPPGGPYRFQLVVVDIYGNTTTCTVPVNIVAP